MRISRVLEGAGPDRGTLFYCGVMRTLRGVYPKEAAVSYSMIKRTRWC